MLAFPFQVLLIGTVRGHVYYAKILFANHQGTNENLHSLLNMINRIVQDLQNCHQRCWSMFSVGSEASDADPC